MKLTPEQYTELKKAQDAFQEAQANLRRVMALIGLDMSKPYIISFDVEELLPQKDA